MYRTDANVSLAANHAANHAAASATGSVKSGDTAGQVPRYRSRDFGTGYGSSSGYAAARRYAPGGEPAPRFRLV